MQKLDTAINTYTSVQSVNKNDRSEIEDMLLVSTQVSCSSNQNLSNLVEMSNRFLIGLAQSTGIHPVPRVDAMQ